MTRPTDDRPYFVSQPHPGRQEIAKPSSPASEPRNGSSEASLGNIDYPGGFYREQAPVHLNYICALNGVRGPDLNAPFTYCEIGCGTGETTAALAALHAQGSFFGIDLSESHIDQASELANKSGLTNTQFIAADVATLALKSLPDFDFVTLHGLYAWVPEPVQAAIRKFLSAKLKPGGVAYVSYNAMPGWGSVAPLRQFFVDTARHLQGDTLSKAGQVIATLADLREKKAPFFRENPVAEKIVTRLLSADLRYVAHEYLGPSWRPLYFAEVHDPMTAEGLRFVAEAEIAESLLEHSVAPSFVERLLGEPDVCRRETLRDFIQNRFFRRDVYMKPGLDETTVTTDKLLLQTLFGMVADPVQIPENIILPDAPSTHFEGPWFERVKKLLGYRVLTLAEILDDRELQEYDHNTLIEGMRLLSIGGFLTPCISREVIPPRGPADTIRVVPKINQIRLYNHDWSEPGFTLASPVTGAGISLSPFETVLLSGVQHADPLPWIQREFEKYGMYIRSTESNTAITDEDEAKRALQDAMNQFLRYKLPKLAYLGVVEAA